MGAQLATTNKALVDKLVDKYLDKNSQVEGAFRAVDRAMYYELEEGIVINPYDENPWRLGNLHLSAPCIYAKVVDAFDLKPGMSFLNLGSGTGYLNTIVGLLIGPNGINHGIEIHADVVDFANKKLDEFMKNNPAIDKFDFSEPVFICGNFINLNPEVTSYDRIYLGAGCLPSMEMFMKKLVKPNGGILIMPYENRLVRYIRVGENEWQSEELMKVYFTMMIGQGEEDKATLIEMPQPAVKSLKMLCRIFIRQQFREKTNWLNPNLLNSDNVDRRRHRRAMATLAMRRAEQQRQQAKMIASMSSAANQLQSASSASKSMRSSYHDGAIDRPCRVCHSKRHQRTSKRKCCQCYNGHHRPQSSVLVTEQDSRNMMTGKGSGGSRYSPANANASNNLNSTSSRAHTRMMTRFTSRQLVATDNDDAMSTLPGTSTTTSDRNQTTDNDDQNSYTTPNEHSPGQSSDDASSDDAASASYNNMCNNFYHSIRGTNKGRGARVKSNNKRHQQRAFPRAFQNDNCAEFGYRSALSRSRTSTHADSRSSIEMFRFQAFTLSEILHDQPMTHFMRYRLEHQFYDSRQNLFQVVEPESNDAFNSSHDDNSSSSSESASESRYMSDLEADTFADARHEERRGSNNGRESTLDESLNSFLEHAYANINNIDDSPSSNNSDDDGTPRNMEHDSTESDDWSLFASSSSESSARSLCSSGSSSSVWASDLYDDDDDDDDNDGERWKDSKRPERAQASHDEPVASRLRSKLVLLREPWRQASAPTTKRGSNSGFSSAVSHLLPLNDTSLRPGSSNGDTRAQKIDPQAGTSSLVLATRKANYITSPENERSSVTNKRQWHSYSSSQIVPLKVDHGNSSSKMIDEHPSQQQNLGLAIGSPSLPFFASSVPESLNTAMKLHNSVSRFTQMTKSFGSIGDIGQGSSIADRTDASSRAVKLPSSFATRASNLAPKLTTLTHQRLPVRELRSSSVARASVSSVNMASGGDGSARTMGLSRFMGAEPEDAEHQLPRKQHREARKLASQHEGSVLIGRKRKRRSSSESSESNASSPLGRQASKIKPAPNSGSSYMTRRATRSSTCEPNAPGSSRHTTVSTLSRAGSTRASSSGPCLEVALERVVLLNDGIEDNTMEDDEEDIDNHLLEPKAGHRVGSIPVLCMRKETRQAHSVANKCDSILLGPTRPEGTTTRGTRLSPERTGATVLTVSPHTSSRRHHPSAQAERQGRQAQLDRRAGQVTDDSRRRCIHHHRHRHHHHCHHHRRDPRCRYLQDRHRCHRLRNCRHLSSSSSRQHSHHGHYLCRNHRQTSSHSSQQQPSLERELLTRRRVERERRVKRSAGAGLGSAASGLAGQAAGNGERARTRQRKKRRESECEKYRNHISGYIRRLQVPLVLQDYLNFEREFP